MNTLDATIGISVSEPGEQELAERGLMEEHIRHGFIEIARQILAAGGSLAYGGDLRAQGYTQTLIALLRTYSRADRPANARINQFLARPVWERLSPIDARHLNVYMTPTFIHGVGEESHDRAGRARDFTAMREAMTKETQARVVIGGRLAGQQGRWPGIVEEAFLAILAGQPLFVCGGFGGAAARVAAAIHGDWPPELSTDFQVASTAGYDELLAAGVGPDDGELRRVLTGAALQNGLDPPDNEALLRTTDLDLMVALILRGLTALQ
jgi:hypothetical protein